MEDVLKRECIALLVDQGMAESKAMLEGLGIEFMPFDDIDKQVMINKMFHVCESSGVDILFCEEFLKSEVYTTYMRSIKKMTGVILDKMSDYMENKTKH